MSGPASWTREIKGRGAAACMGRDCLALRLRLLNRAVSAVYDDALRPWGLKVSQANVLAALQNMEGATPTRLGRALLLGKSTLSRNLERMREQGLLRSAPGDDGRTVIFQVSAAGRRLLEDLLPAWRRAQREVHELLGEDGVSALHDLADSAWHGTKPA